MNRILDIIQRKEYAYSDLKGNLFQFYKTLLNKCIIQCPDSKSKCLINNVKQKLFISQIPYYIVLNIQNSQTVISSSCYNDDYNREYIFSLDTLYSMFMITGSFKLSSLFEHYKKYIIKKYITNTNLYLYLI